MADVGGAFIAIAIAAIVMYLERRHVAELYEAFKEALENLNNNWPRGGPPTPMHPSPVGDDSSHNSSRP